MATYKNGYIPAGVLHTYVTGTDVNGYWEFQSTAATWARWQMAKKYAETHFGRTMYIRTGWNIYRPYNIQVDARVRACANHNCAGAAMAGTSSHGGNWYYNNALRDCLAIDVDNNGLTWAQVWEACRSAGFACGLITKAISAFPDGEPWHIIDFGAFGPVPAGGDSTAFPNEENDMTPEQDALLKNIAGFLYAGGTSVADPKYLGVPGTVYNMLKQPVYRGTGTVTQVQDNADTNTMVRELIARPAAGVTKEQIDAIIAAVTTGVVAKLPTDIQAQVDVDAIAKAVRAEFTENPLH